jgi:ABC-type Na+ efflux pump permease subunit
VIVNAAWIIAKKDLKQRLRDRSAYIIGVVAPLGLALVFGFVLTGVRSRASSSRTFSVGRQASRSSRSKRSPRPKRWSTPR